MASIHELMKLHPTLSLTSSGKVKDGLTGHEMPNRLDVVTSYVAGDKYRKAKEWYSRDYSKYAPHIVASKNSDKRLFCTLTREELNKIPSEAEAFVQSGRYQRALAAYLAKEDRDKRRAAGEMVEESDDEEEEEGMGGQDEDGEEEEEEEEEPLVQEKLPRGAKKLGGGGGGKGAAKRAAVEEDEEEADAMEEEAPHASSEKGRAAGSKVAGKRARGDARAPPPSGTAGGGAGGKAVYASTSGTSANFKAKKSKASAREA